MRLRYGISTHDEEGRFIQQVDIEGTQAEIENLLATSELLSSNGLDRLMAEMQEELHGKTE